VKIFEGFDPRVGGRISQGVKWFPAVHAKEYQTPKNALRFEPSISCYKYFFFRTAVSPQIYRNFRPAQI
jgi:hypothetical protein